MTTKLPRYAVPCCGFVPSAGNYRQDDLGGGY
jgi:hypothetical protein